MKGIILLGGAGSRLWPMTKVISKQLLNIYDKPMCYYSLSILMHAKIQDVCIISDPENIGLYEKLLGNGDDWGMRFTYVVQPKPQGIAQAFVLAEEFLTFRDPQFPVVTHDPVCLVLGDNIFFGHGLPGFLASMKDAVLGKKGACVAAYRVKDPHRYGVVHFDANGKALCIEEKPFNPKSNYAVPGIYFYDSSAVSYAKELKPSARGELEISDLNARYLQNGDLEVKVMPRGFAWLDTGTVDALMESHSFVQAIESRQGIKVACLEEIAYRNGWISIEQLRELGLRMQSCNYGKYLIEIARNKGM